MGYTHYWETTEQLVTIPFAAFVDDVVKLADLSVVKLAGWNGERGTQPEFASDEFTLNGCGDLSHETFGIAAHNTGFQFCKTARKPYDEIVTAALILFAARFGDQVTVSSDGTAEDWQAGLSLACKLYPAATIPAGVTS